MWRKESATLHHGRRCHAITKAGRVGVRGEGYEDIAAMGRAPAMEALHADGFV